MTLLAWLLAVAASVLVLAALLAFIGGVRADRGSVGAFACHDCAMGYLSVALPYKTVQATLDALTEQHRGHRIWSAVNDV